MNFSITRSSIAALVVALISFAALCASLLVPDLAGAAAAQAGSDQPQDISLANANHSHPLISFDSRQLAAPSPAPSAGVIDPNDLVQGSTQQRQSATFQAAESHPYLPITFLTLPGFDLVFLIDADSGVLLAELPIAGEPNGIAFSPDGNTVYFSSRSLRQIMRLELESYYLGEFDQGDITNLAIPNPALDIEIGADGRIWVLSNSGIYAVSPDTGERVTRRHSAYTVYSGEIEVNTQGTRLYYGDRGTSPASLSVFDVSSDDPTPIYEAPFGVNGGNGQDLELSPDGSKLLFATGSGQDDQYAIALYNTDDFSVDTVYETGAYPQAVGFSPDGLWIYTANQPQIVDAWRATAPFEKVASFEFAEGEAFEIHIEQTSQMMYVLTGDGRAYPISTGTIRDDVALCGGGVVTVDLAQGQMPTSGADVIAGTAGDDTIDTGGGFVDIVCGLDGDDTITISAGRGAVYGGPGDDALFGGQNSDFLVGEGGDDKLYGRAGNDGIDGGPGDDVMHGDRGDDLMWGGDGIDRMFGYADDDTMEGGPGNDRMHGNFGNDTMSGQGGNDRMFGYGDNDVMDGGAGNDILGGNRNDDTITGGAGNDRIYGSDGADTVSGGEGNDKVEGNSGPDIVHGNGGDDALDGGINPDMCDGGDGIDTATRCETVVGIP